MTFKINISEKSGKTYKLETEGAGLIGKQLHDKIQGNELNPDLAGYELEITGASDKAGFTAMKDVEGVGLKKVLLSYGKGMKKRPRREGKKKLSTNKPKGLRLRKSVRGKTISLEIVQINLKVVKEGSKKLSEIFPDQNQPKPPKENRAFKRKQAKEKPKEEVKEEPATEVPKEESKEEVKSEEAKEETTKE